MTDDLLLYSNPMSRGRIVRWMLEEVGQPYRVQYLGYGPDMKAPDFLALNPMGKVPVLAHGDAVVSEGGAICAYLAAAFPEAGLQPTPGTPAYADYLRWMFFAAGPTEAAITARALGHEVPTERKGFVGYGSYDDVVDGLERMVAGKTYIAGDRFSAADVYAGAQIGYGLRFKSLPARPAFEDYWAGIADRPAMKRAAELDDAALPVAA